jgi:3D (Asp-Asp-Asp) domain-containing protein
MKRASRLWLACLGPALIACNTAGSAWMAQPLDGELSSALPLEAQELPQRAPKASPTKTIRETPDAAAQAPTDAPPTFGGATSPRAVSGKLLGTFKNTYYDFPSEADFGGEAIDLMNGSCKPIGSVPRSFYESVCVQGSGTLRSGGTVSFAKRDCSCAPECPRTGQHICFDLLDKAQFPWGRGATGKGITPLLSVAVDSSIIPLGTALYIPEYDGVARDASGATRHDGCFLAEDRGLAVKGQQIDVFTGKREITQLWNRLVPSNSGVTVVLDSPRCRRAPQPSG